MANEICEQFEFSDFDFRHKSVNKCTADEQQFKTEVSWMIKSEITRTVAEVKCYALQQVSETLSEVKEQLKTTAKEIERERSDMKIERGFRKFMFWATPILLLAQIFAILFLILR